MAKLTKLRCRPQAIQPSRQTLSAATSPALPTHKDTALQQQSSAAAAAAAALSKTTPLPAFPRSIRTAGPRRPGSVHGSLCCHGSPRTKAPAAYTPAMQSNRSAAGVIKGRMQILGNQLGVL